MLAILLCDGVFSFSLKELSICKGKVWPFSQISMSFLIFSYTIEKKVSWGSTGNKISMEGRSQYVGALKVNTRGLYKCLLYWQLHRVQV